MPVIPFGLSVALLLSDAGIATVIPVCRATALDPMVALRYEWKSEGGGWDRTASLTSKSRQRKALPAREI